MKHKLLSAVVLTMLMISTTFAKDVDNKVSQRVLTTFSEKFANATEVKWVKTESYVKASFTWNDQSLMAYYTEDGELIGISRNIPSSQLPIQLQTGLNRHLAESWITELYEFATESGTAYYATVENANEKITLKSSGSTNWSVYKKESK